MSELISTFILFFAVIDPIGTVPVFISVTTQYDEITKRKIAYKATLASGAILVFFVVAGQVILKAIGTPLSAFQIAGGLVLMIFALSMIFGESKPECEIKMAKSSTEQAIYPLALPSIASPGAMLAAVLLTDNRWHTPLEQVQTTMAMISVVLVVLVLMLGASKVHRFIGDAGASVISRVMGLILTSVAVSNILEGFKLYFDL